MMLRSKSEIDRHVREMFGKIKSDNDANRKLKGLNVARLYYNVKEYESAKRYVSEFLSLRPKSSEAHKLLAQILEGLEEKDKAIQSYKTSYEIADSQNDLLLKICELYHNVDDDITIKLHWVEEAEKKFPHNETISALRHSLMSNGATQSRDELEKLYLDEIKCSPLSVNLYLVLLKFYLEWGVEKPSKIVDAYNFILQVELKNPFADSYDWYHKVEKVLEEYHNLRQPTQDKEFQELYLRVLERQVDLCVSEAQNAKFNPQCSQEQALSTLSNFDSRMANVDNKLISAVLMKHLSCQYYYHLARQVMNFAKQENVLQSEELIALLLALAMKDLGDTSVSTLRKSSLKHRSIRLSQSGHIWQHLVASSGDSASFFEKLRVRTSISSTRQTIFETAMPHRSVNKSGFLMTDKSFEDVTFKVVPDSSLLSSDKAILSTCSSDLSLLLWVLVQNDLPTSFGQQMSSQTAQLLTSDCLLSGLSFSSVMSVGTAESLCTLDVIAFLAATLFCTGSNSEHVLKDLRGKFLCGSNGSLFSHEQGEWWNAAVGLFENSGNRRLNRLRAVLQKGLEAIRLLGLNSPPLPVVAHIAQVYSQLIGKLEKVSYTKAGLLDSLEERAEQYWLHVVHQCELINKSSRTVGMKLKLFDLKRCELSAEQSDSLVSQGRLFLAQRLARRGKRTEALLQFGQLRTPEASFQRALLYKESAEDLVAEKTFPLITSVHEEYTKNLTQARDALYLTLDRLKAPGISSTHPLNLELHAQLSVIQQAIETAAFKRNNDLMLDEHNESQSFHLPAVLNSHLMHEPCVSSTPCKPATPLLSRQEVRPSPERLDVQVRHLMELQQSTMKSWEERNVEMKAQTNTLMVFMEKMHIESKENVAFYRSLIQEKQNTDNYTPLQSQITSLEDMMKDLLIDVRSIATEVADLRSFKVTQKEELKVEESEAKAAIDLANMQPAPGMYGNYPMSFYARPGYPSVPSMFAGCPRPFVPPGAMPNDANFIPQGVRSDVSISDHPPAMAFVQPSPQMISTVVSLPSSVQMMAPRPQVADPVNSPHAFQMTMPQSSMGAFSPIVQGQLTSKSTTFSTQGFLSDIPAPAYSAVRPELPAKEAEMALATAKIQGPASVSNLSQYPCKVQVAPVAPSKPAPSVAVTPHSVPAANVSVSANKSLNESHEDEEYEPNVDFVPVIDLPDLIEVKTGEEDEEILFDERAKLYRYEPTTKEWKERGVGVMRLLKNTAKGMVRVLMRRDQTHKICANHLITATMKLSPMDTAEKAWMWAANDFADEQVKYEKLAVRFKTKELSDAFKEGFESASKLIVQTPAQKPQETAKAAPTSMKSLSDMFKPASGSWECDACLVRNKPGTESCCACQTTKPGCTPAAAPTPPLTKPSTFAGFSFGIKPTDPPTSTSPSPAFSFAVSAQPTSTKAAEPCFSFAAKPTAVSSSDTVNTFSFGVTPSTTSASLATTTSSTTQAKPSFTFGFANPAAAAAAAPAVVFSSQTAAAPATPLSTFTFSTAAPTSDKTQPKVMPSLSESPMFSSQPSIGFDSIKSNDTESIFKTTVTSDFEKKSLFGNAPENGSLEQSKENVEDYEPTIEFAPVIDMPELVDVKTGEEDEEKLFKERCKLFRFVPETTEWKERGLGNIQILKNSSTRQVRILMRRDQTHKICANHLITADIKLCAMETSDKSWMWAANDYADEHLKVEKLAVRFKNQDLANQFKEQFEQAQTTFTTVEPVAAVSPVTPVVISIKTSTSLQPSASTPAASMPSIFGGTSSSPGSIFGGASPSASTLFGGVSSSPQAIFGGLSTPNTSGIFSKPSLFSNSSKSDLTTSFNAAARPDISVQPIFTNGDTIGFGQVTNQTPSEGIFKTKNASAFKPQSLFSSTPRQTETRDKNDSNNDAEEYVPTVDFKPVIDLPELIEVKTGEEDQESMFKERCKLYRYIADTKEWKERGIGNISILKDTSAQKVRVLMRRDQTHKICANHFITSDMKITDMLTSDKAWMWVAQDFSDEQLKFEKLAVRFKTQQLADKFKSEFEAAQQYDQQQGTKTVIAPKATVTVDQKASLADMFKPASGSWECGTCLVRNKGTDAACAACNTTKPGAAPPTTSIFGGATTISPSFTFGMSAKPHTPTPAKSIFDTSTDSNTTPATPATPATASFSFGKSTFSPKINGGSSETPTFMFGGNSPSSAVQRVSTWTPPVFSTPTSAAFTFNTTDVQPSRSRDASLCESEVTEDEGDHLHFEPVVPLPDRVDVVTGEEEESPLYTHRAKLFRMVDGEWKERGLGDVKILLDTKTNRVRLLMRREQVLKICLNHFLAPTMTFQKIDARVVSWAAQDYADMEPRREIFSLRFKTAEVAGEFVAALSEARVRIGGEPLDLGFQTQSATTDVEATYERKATDEQIEKARQLLLPDNFYLFENAEPCSGCVGCEVSEVSDQQADLTDQELDQFDGASDDSDDDEDSFVATCRMAVKEGCTWQELGMCTMNIRYDSDSYCNHICIYDDESGEVVVDHPITKSTTHPFPEQGNALGWTATDDIYGERKTFKATFETREDSQDFSRVFSDGKDCAEYSQLNDPWPTDGQ